MSWQLMSAMSWHLTLKLAPHRNHLNLSIVAILFHQLLSGAAGEFQHDLSRVRAAFPRELGAVAIVTRDSVGDVS